MGNATVSKQDLKGAKVFRVQGTPHYLIQKDGRTFTGKSGSYYELGDADYQAPGIGSETTYRRPGHNDHVIVSTRDAGKLQCTGRRSGRRSMLIQLPASRAAAVVRSARRFASLPIYDVPRAVYRLPDGRYLLRTSTFYAEKARIFIGMPGAMKELSIASKSRLDLRDGGSHILTTNIGKFFFAAGFDRTIKSTFTPKGGVKVQLANLNLTQKAIKREVTRLGVRLRKKASDPRSLKLFCD